MIEDKLNMPGRWVRNAARWKEVMGVLAKLGWSHFFQSEAPQVQASTTRSKPEQLAESLIELGPTAIKLGQILSTRADLISPEYAKALERLQYEVEADPPEFVRQRVEAELGAPLDVLFASFDLNAFASASIGQVHKAQLHTGEHVVVKVRHQGISSIIFADLSILLEMAQQLERFDAFVRYQPVAVVTEFRRLLLGELDFRQEAQNLQQFHLNFMSDTSLKIPKIYPEQSTQRILVMEYLQGTALSRLNELDNNHLDFEVIAKKGVNLYLKMIFEHRLYHADPHPGNILLLQDEGQIGLLDFGMVGRLDRKTKLLFEEMILSIAQGDTQEVTRLLLILGKAPMQIDREQLLWDVDHFMDTYLERPFAEINVSAALSHMTQIIRQYHILMPTSVTMLLKVIVMLEGTSKHLSPTFDFVECLKPYARKIIMSRLSPDQQWKRTLKWTKSAERLLDVVPQGIVDFLKQIENGSFDVVVTQPQQQNQSRLQAMVVLTGAFILAGAWMTSNASRPDVFTVGWVLLGVGLLLFVICLWLMLQSTKA